MTFARARLFESWNDFDPFGYGKAGQLALDERFELALKLGRLVFPLLRLLQHNKCVRPLSPLAASCQLYTCKNERVGTLSCLRATTATSRTSGCVVSCDSTASEETFLCRINQDEPLL